MSDTRNRIRQLTDSFGLEIERLIKKLPGADPHLRGDPDDQAPPSPPRPSRAIPASAGTSPSTNSAILPALTPRQLELIGAWLRTVAATGLGAAVLYWPYAHDCGWLLHAYLGVVGAVLVSGCWASWTAWRARVAAAHVTALIVVFWGIVLAAEQLLPRIGYAAVDAAWKCSV